jgi:5'-3' exonuclease
LASLKYELRLAIATVNASAKSPGPLSLRQQHYRRYRSAGGGISGGAAEDRKIVTRDEPVEQHPARQEKIDEARMKSRADSGPGSRRAQ